MKEYFSFGIVLLVLRIIHATTPDTTTAASKVVANVVFLFILGNCNYLVEKPKAQEVALRAELLDDGKQRVEKQLS